MRAMADAQATIENRLRAYYEGGADDPAPGVVVSASGELPAPQDSTRGPLPNGLYEDRALIVLALRLDGYSYLEIEKKTGLSADQIRYACRKARQAGTLRDTIDLIDNEAVPQAVDNLLAMLQDPKNDSHEKATFKVLEGRGALRRFSGDKVGGGGVGGIPPLQINILTPTGGSMPTVIVNSERGAVIGEPRGDA